MSLSRRKSKTQSHHRVLFIPIRRKGKMVDKTLEEEMRTGSTKRNKESVSQSRLGFGSQLRKCKVLAPLTSTVAIWVVYVCGYLSHLLFYFQNMCKKSDETLGFFCYCGRQGLWFLCLRITHRVMKNQSSVVQSRK